MSDSKSYHIYIHNDKGRRSPTKPNPPSQGGGNGSGTVPNPPSQGGGGGTPPRVPGWVPGSRVVNTANRLSNARGLALANAIVATTILVVKATEQAITSANDYVSAQTGDYTAKLGWDNAMQTQKNVLHPVSSTIQAYLTRETWERRDKALAEERSLLGDTALNTLTKGV